MRTTQRVFVPYRGFYFLNRNCKRHEKRRTGSQFSSPIGAFIFLIIFVSYDIDKKSYQFSSPIGAFIFLIEDNERMKPKEICFRPLSGLLFS